MSNGNVLGLCPADFPQAGRAATILLATSKLNVTVQVLLTAVEHGWPLSAIPGQAAAAALQEHGYNARLAALPWLLDSAAGAARARLGAALPLQLL